VKSACMCRFWKPCFPLTTCWAEQLVQRGTSAHAASSLGKCPREALRRVTSRGVARDELNNIQKPKPDNWLYSTEQWHLGSSLGSVITQPDCVMPEIPNNFCPNFRGSKLFRGENSVIIWKKGQ
jgi:hypothetical protein